MKLTTGQIYAVMHRYEGNKKSVIDELINQKMSVSVAYKIKILISKFMPIYNAAEECRVKLLKELGTEKEGSISIFDSSEENQKKFQEQYYSLMSQENEIDMEKIIIDCSQDANKNISIEPSKVGIIDSFIEVK